MKRLRPLLLFVLLSAAGYGVYWYLNRLPTTLILTGIVTTNDVIVSPQIAGQIERLAVKEGDVVKKDQLVALITPDELKADTAYFAQNVEGLSSQVRESEAALRYQERQMADQIAQVFRDETTYSGVHGMVGVISLSLRTMIVRLPRRFSPSNSTTPSISAITAGSFGLRASKISVTRGRPPVMSCVPDTSRGVLANRAPAEITLPSATSM